MWQAASYEQRPSGGSWLEAIGRVSNSFCELLVEAIAGRGFYDFVHLPAKDGRYGAVLAVTIVEETNVLRSYRI